MWIVDVLDDFLWMADVHLYLFCKTKQCSLHKVFEKWQVLEDLLIRLF